GYPFGYFQVFVIGYRLQQREDRLRIFHGIERTFQSSALLAALRVDIADVCLLDACRVYEQYLGECSGSGCAVYLSFVTIPDQPRKQTDMIGVRVGDDDLRNGGRIESEVLIEGQGIFAHALEQAAVEEDTYAWGNV